jgi:cation diffusion facilitator CzcD-associated flavoprotein CzcO
MNAPTSLESSDETPPWHRLPVAVIGAGPIGLVAGAHLVSKGQTR